MQVQVSDVLMSYTGSATVQAHGNTLLQLFDDLERQFPGLRFRVVNELNELRPHLKVFVNKTLEHDLTTQLDKNSEVMILQALSGG